MWVWVRFSRIWSCFYHPDYCDHLNRHGITYIETTRQAAEALGPWPASSLRPCYVGIVGVGFLAIPTLAGSAAYAFAETLGWRQGLDKKLKQARAFYTLILLSTGWVSDWTS